MMENGKRIHADYDSGFKGGASITVDEDMNLRAFLQVPAVRQKQLGEAFLLGSFSYIDLLDCVVSKMSDDGSTNVFAGFTVVETKGQILRATHNPGRTMQFLGASLVEWQGT